MGPAPKLRWSAATSDKTGRPRLRLAWPAEQQLFGLDSCISCNSRDFLDHLVIGPSGVFVVDSKQYTGRVHQSLDGRAWHNHAPLDRQLAVVGWEAATIARVLGVRVDPMVCVHGAEVADGGLIAQGVAVVPAGRLRAALGVDPVLSAADVSALAAMAQSRLRAAA
jgi:Nuclease-related domain